MNAYREIFRDQLTEIPKRQNAKQQQGYNSHLGWVFVCNEFSEKPKAVRTYHSLFGASNAYTYFTPNSFYRNDQRHSGALRWLNAMVIDIDAKHDKNIGMILPDLMDVINDSGLPEPSLIVSTPNKGFHVYWYFTQSKRAWPKVIEHYKRIQTSIVEIINGDPQAIGAERWFRMPNSQNIIYQSENRISFDELCDWLAIYQEDCIDEREHNAVFVGRGSLLHHPAILKLMEGVSEGQRDNTCYTLALAYKASGYDEKETEIFLNKWNQYNDPPMRELDIKRKIKSAFKKGAPAGPTAYWIKRLSGMKFNYQVWEDAKPREERIYSHFNEWEKDVIRYLKKEGGVAVGSQRKIAKAIRSSSDNSKSIPFSTFKKVIEHLIQIGVITKKIEGKGRAAITIIAIKKSSNVIPFPTKKARKKAQKNGFNSNTFIDPVVGGLSFSKIKTDIDSIYGFD